MAIKRSQQIFMWSMVVVMTVGTMGAFFLPLVISGNEADDRKAQQEMINKMLAEQKAQQAAKPAGTPLEGYSAEQFDAASVKKLKTEDIVKGDGDATVTASSTIKANYFGWTADGKIFDSTNKEGRTTPIEFPLDGVIQGWTKGLEGAKIGTVRKLTIPADMAYGENAAAGGNPAGPLMFIVEVTEIK